MMGSRRQSSDPSGATVTKSGCPAVACRAEEYFSRRAVRLIRALTPRTSWRLHSDPWEVLRAGNWLRTCRAGSNNSHQSVFALLWSRGGKGNDAAGGV